jgi:hypothetical protein
VTGSITAALTLKGGSGLGGCGHRGRAKPEGLAPSMECAAQWRAGCGSSDGTSSSSENFYFNGMRSIFAATMKSFSDKPLIEWVVNCTRQ